MCDIVCSVRMSTDSEVLPTQDADAKGMKASASSVGGEKLTLEGLIEGIEKVLVQGQPTELKNRKEVKNLLERFDAGLNELDKYSFFDPNKRYTRNLVATDGKTYTLMLLCWTADKESPIHDHPNAGCWMRVIKGTLVEKQYVKEGNRLIPTTSTEAPEGSVLYIDDSMCLHKVGCLTDDGAVSLHLYSPPFKKCSIWMNEDMDANKPLQPIMTFYSEYGKIVDYSPSPTAKYTSKVDSNAEEVVAIGIGGSCTSELAGIIHDYELTTSYSDPAITTDHPCSET